jgi:uncharacterized short protein YbdD (DUF466 family)/virulence-associated protein VapD
VLKINECILIGGGCSIKDGISLGLKDYLKDHFVIACNYAYKHFSHNLTCFVDKDFYVPHHAKKYPDKHPDIYEELKRESMIIGINHNGVEEFRLPNTILVKSTYIFKPITNINEDFYTKNFLTGVFAISVGCFLLNYSGVIYLLGFDWTKEGETHYYSKEEINHVGNGYTASYAKHNPHNIYKPFTTLKNIKFYNVSPNSNINNFEKISYSQFFDLLSKNK